MITEAITRWKEHSSSSNFAQDEMFKENICS